MASGSGSSGALRPLSVGNVISTAVRLYGANLKKFLRLAGIATLWGLLSFAIAVLGIGLIVGGAASQSVGLVVIGSLIILAWIPVAIFCAAYAMAYTATITRLAYGELIEQPESLQAARDLLLRKKWYLLLTGVMAGIILWAINMGLTVVFQYIPMFGAMAIFGAESGAASVANLIGNLVVLVIYYWFMARWFLPVTIMAMEPDGGIDGALGRSWKLSEGSAWRILAIILLAGLIALPFVIVAFVPLIVSAVAAAPLFANQGTPSPGDVQQMLIAFGSGLVVSLLLFFGLNIFLMPFNQAIQAVVYGDLRNRREGVGLKLRGGDRPPA
jgi:hypothetical protein